MKRRDLMKKFEDKGWYHKRDSGPHEVISDGRNIEFIPRHKEINERLAKALIKKWKI